MPTSVPEIFLPRSGQGEDSVGGVGDNQVTRLNMGGMGGMGGIGMGGAPHLNLALNLAPTLTLILTLSLSLSLTLTPTLTLTLTRYGWLSQAQLSGPERTTGRGQRLGA